MFLDYRQDLMFISIIIKSLNEEKNIRRAIESALVAVEPYNGEVILADSLSIDNTVDIAQSYPIRIVQLINAEDRSCGVGAQLGFQVAKGQFVYILDADMEFENGFLDAAIKALTNASDLAGVAGFVKEMHVENLAFRNRVNNSKSHMPVGEVSRLDMGGLYRRAALEEVAYFTNRNLNSYEELELGARLIQKGWRLERLDVPSVKHYGHTDSSYKLLFNRWKSGYIRGIGELLRTSFGKTYFRYILKDLSELKLQVLILAWWALLILLGILVLLHGVTWHYLIVLSVMPLLVMLIKKKKVNSAIYSFIALNVRTLGTIVGIIAFNKSKNNNQIEYKQLN